MTQNLAEGPKVRYKQSGMAGLARASRTEAPQGTAAQPFSLLKRQGPWRDALRRRFLAAADAVAFALAVVLVGLYEGIETALWLAALLPLAGFFAKWMGLYEADHGKIRHLTGEESGRLFHWATLTAAVSALLMTVLPPGGLKPLAALALWATLFGASFLGRAAARMLWRRFVPRERGLVLGDGRLAEAVARKLMLESGHHLDLVASCSVAGHEGEPELSQAIAGARVDRVVLAMQDLDEQTLSDVVAACRTHSVKLSVAPPLRAMLGTAVQLHHLAELPVIEYRTWDTSRSTMALKRLVDVIGAGVGLVVCAPLLALIALAVKLDSRGPAFYLQTRAGHLGRPFRMIKFRTMVKDAHMRVAEVVGPETLDDPMFKLKRDPRTTRGGRLLRRTSLDELPQLVNVLLGHMSLVGPRPEEVWLVERYSETERFRLDMRPGLTGPMQVHGRGELTFQERLAVEREYVENYSFLKDVQIMLRTVSVVVRGNGAF